MADDFPVTIYHNPACGTSRNTLAIIEAAGHRPTVIEYLKEGWTRPQLEDLLKAMGAAPRDILREKDAPAELRAPEGGASDDAVLRAMLENPGLVNRPIVVTPKGTKLCRPRAEEVLTLLERPPEPFSR